MDAFRKVRLLALAAGSELQIERTKNALVVTGFLPEWSAMSDVSQGREQEIVDILKMSPITSNVTRAAFSGMCLMLDGAALVFNNSGAAWYLFLSPSANEEQIGSAATDARARIIQAMMAAEHANDTPRIGY